MTRYSRDCFFAFCAVPAVCSLSVRPIEVLRVHAVARLVLSRVMTSIRLPEANVSLPWLIRHALATLADWVERHPR